MDTSNFVLKTKLASDVTALENKIDAVDKKIPDISGLASKTSLNDYLQTVDTRITSIETNLNGFKKSDLTGYAKKPMLLQILLQ